MSALQENFEVRREDSCLETAAELWQLLANGCLCWIKNSNRQQTWHSIPNAYLLQLES
jgi:hypothetical protein